MAATLPVSLLVDQLDNSDLADRLYENKQPSLTQLSKLAVPGVVRELEKRWYMPVTNNVKFFLLNYPFHHYTVNWQKYMRTSSEAFFKALNDGYEDEVEKFLFTEPEMVNDKLLSVEHFLRAAKRGSVSIIQSLRDHYESPSMNGDVRINKIRFALKRSYYYAVCRSGDMELFEEMRKEIDPTNVNLIDSLREAAIEGGHLPMVAVLYENYEAEAIHIRYGLYDALEKGNLEIVMYFFQTYQDFVTEDYQKAQCLGYALRSGNPAVINFILMKFRLKFNITHLDDVIRGGNKTILTRFEKQFPDTFGPRLVKNFHILGETGNSEIVPMFIAHGWNDWYILISTAIFTSNYAFLDLAIQYLGLEQTYDYMMSIQDKGPQELNFIEYLDAIIESQGGQ